MAEIVAPDFTAALPDPKFTYQPPRTASLLDVGLSAALGAANEVADAMHEARKTREQLLAAADVMDDVDPTQAELYRRMAQSTESYAPLSGASVDARGAARAGSSAAGRVRGAVLDDVLAYIQQTNLQRMKQEGEMAQINARAQAEIDVARFRAGAQGKLEELRQRYQNATNEERARFAAQEAVINARSTGYLSEDEANQAVAAINSGDHSAAMSIVASKVDPNAKIAIEEQAAIRRRQMEMMYQVIDENRAMRNAAKMREQFPDDRSGGINIPGTGVTVGPPASEGREQMGSFEVPVGPDGSRTIRVPVPASQLYPLIQAESNPYQNAPRQDRTLDEILGGIDKASDILLKDR